MKLTRLLLAILLTFGVIMGAPPNAADKKAAPAAAVAKAGQCQAKTQDGDQCKRKAAEGSKFCWQHDPNRKSKKGAAKKS
jgi:hypothetical protein